MAARAFLRHEPRSLFLGNRCTHPSVRIRSYHAHDPTTPVRTGASTRHMVWPKYAGTFCTVAALYAISAEAETVAEVDGPGMSIVTAARPRIWKRPTIPVPTFNAEKVDKKEQHRQSPLENIDLIVCDMAGTTVMEGGVVYKTLRAAMNADGLDVSEEEMHAWHGAKKEAVILHFAKEQEHSETSEDELQLRVKRVSHLFENMIADAYFGEDSPVRLIDEDLKSWMGHLQARGTRCALNTGYPPKLQMDLMKKLGLDSVVDGAVSAYEVKEGRPAPYMIFKLMENLGVVDVRRVAKVGDTVRDIQEGRNAGCGLVVGVLSGADSEEMLLAAGADMVVPLITDLAVPMAATSAAADIQSKPSH